MPPLAPPRLVDELSSLGLATAEQIAGVAKRVQRLARELPHFESVWVDCLVQAGVLSPLQAARVNAGQASSLILGPYVLQQALSLPGWGNSYLARERETDRTVRLLVVERNQDCSVDEETALRRLLDRSAQASGSGLAPVMNVAHDGGRVWSACRHATAITASEWLVENGRLPPMAVLHIARQMVAALAELERLELLHGDLSASSLMLTASGQVVLTHPGLRPVLRPAEGYAYGELSPEAYDTLAPERLLDGLPHSVASEMYACGALWWQLLAGRPPLAGGNTLAKLRQIQTGRITEIGRLAPQTPAVLSQIVAACLSRDPGSRPRSFAELAAKIGPPTRGGAQHLVAVLAAKEPVLLARRTTSRASRTVRRAEARSSWPVTLGTAAVILLAIGSWPVWRNRGAASSKTPVVAAAPVISRPNQEAPDVKNQNVAKTAVAGSPGSASPSAASNERVQPSAENGKVVRASANVPVASASATNPTPKPSGQLAGKSANRVLQLPAEVSLATTELPLRPGLVVRGAGDQRATLRVPSHGLLISCEDVTFENVDFVWQAQAAASPNSPRSAPAMLIMLAADRAEFHGCTFRLEGVAPTRAPAAVVWTGSSAGASGGAACSGELVLTECQFEDLGAVVDCRHRQNVHLDVGNSLVIGGQSLLRLPRALGDDQAVSLSLSRLTLRDTQAVIERRCEVGGTSTGSLTVTAEDSALSPATEGALLMFGGERPNPAWLRRIEWAGQGSLVIPQAPIAAWRTPEGKLQTLDDNHINVAGLVRSSIEFGGPVTGGASASRVTRWQAPLRTAEAPGANLEATVRE